MLRYNPYHWYWTHADGRIFSSLARALIQPDNGLFATWLAGGGHPTPWPRDEAGEQTAAALNEVLAPYGFVTGLA